MKKETLIIYLLLSLIFLIQIFDSKFEYQLLQYVILVVMILLAIYYKLIKKTK